MTNNPEDVLNRAIEAAEKGYWSVYHRGDVTDCIEAAIAAFLRSVTEAYPDRTDVKANLRVKKEAVYQLAMELGEK